MNKKNVMLGFILFEMICYMSFFILDINQWYPEWSKGIKYTAILGCFFYSLFLFWKNSFSKERLFVSIAMFFTVLADYCLLLVRQDILGLVAFLGVQGIYLFWLCRLTARIPRKGEIEDRSRKNFKPFLHFLRLFIIRIFFAFFLYFMVIVNFLEEELLYLFVLFYAIMFLDNMRMLLFLFVTRRYQGYGVHLPMLIAGFFLFLCCDLCVLFYNTSALFSIPFPMFSFAYRFVAFGMWFFYLPSQVLIVLSIQKKE